jgi:hypothetical protein
MTTLEQKVCLICGASSEEMILERCMVCGKWFCKECSYKQTGRRFCSSGCARDFFWGIGEEEDEDDTIKDREPEY